MNKAELYMAIHEIDENLITESNDTDNIKTNVFFTKKTLSIAVKTVAILMVIVCTAICYKGFSSLPSKNPTTLPSENTSYPTQQYTETSETTLYVNDDTTSTNDAPIDKDITDVDTDELTTDAVQQEESTTLKPQDKLPDYSLYTLSMWLNEPGVIWSSNTIKGGIVISEKAPMGAVKISDSLKEMFKDNDKSTIYAVLVDFSSCINEEEFDNWKHNDISVSELRSEFEKSAKNDKTIKEYKNKLREIRIAYYEMKIEKFQDSFNKAGLKIYTDKRVPDLSAQFFYTFGTEEQLKKLSCKSDEAFVLALAGEIAF